MHFQIQTLKQGLYTTLQSNLKSLIGKAKFPGKSES